MGQVPSCLLFELKFPNNPVVRLILLDTFYRLGNWASERGRSKRLQRLFLLYHALLLKEQTSVFLGWELQFCGFLRYWVWLLANLQDWQEAGLSLALGLKTDLLDLVWKPSSTPAYFTDHGFRDFNTQEHSTGQKSHKQWMEPKLRLESTPVCFRAVMLEVAGMCYWPERIEPSSGALGGTGIFRQAINVLFPVYKYLLWNLQAGSWLGQPGNWFERLRPSWVWPLRGLTRLGDLL